VENPDDYKKRVAMILPRWCLDVLVDHLDMQYDALTQERRHFESLGDAKSSVEMTQEIQLYLDAIDQITAQLNQT
jgi:hypothetical protein